jgi:hypothetical protein
LRKYRQIHSETIYEPAWLQAAIHSHRPRLPTHDLYDLTTDTTITILSEFSYNAQLVAEADTTLSKQRVNQTCKSSLTLRGEKKVQLYNVITSCFISSSHPCLGRKRRRGGEGDGGENKNKKKTFKDFRIFNEGDCHRRMR